MKTIIILLSVIAFAIKPVYSQKYITKTGHIKFFSSAPLEDIEAHNYQVNSILDLEKSEVVASLLVQNFEFKKDLMREHFNENYMESEKYPKSEFKGSFQADSPINIEQDGIYPVVVDGSLTIHGVTNQINSEGTIEVRDGHLIAFTEFDVALEDYKVKIPRIVIKNIAEVVKVTINLDFESLSQNEI